VVELDGAGDRLISLGVLRTEKSSKKQNVLAAADNFRRAREIGRALARILLENNVDAICAEAMSFPRSSSVAAKMAMCWGVLAQLCEALCLPLVQASPKDIKRAVTGSAAASKDDVQAALSSRFPDAVGLVGSIPRSFHEHAFDAVGAVVACRGSEVLAALGRHAHPGNAYSRSLTKPTEGVADV
jgi:Holliday junction resolvasome RuvABC endonuclease subunit